MPSHASGQSDTTTQQDGASAKAKHEPSPPAVLSIAILVNHRGVKLATPKVTGRQIKEAAIAQGVPIQIDFKLFRVTGSTQHPVDDDEGVTVHEGQEFRCVAPDDNS